VGRLQSSTETAYTALMHYSIHIPKQILATAFMVMVSLMTTGCYTPQCVTYYRQPVTYTPENEVYTTTYSYPAYTPGLIAVESPRYIWDADFHSHVYHQDEGNHVVTAWSESGVHPYRPQQAPQKTFTSQHQFTRTPDSRQCVPSHQYHAAQRVPSPPSTGQAPQRQPALTNS